MRSLLGTVRDRLTARRQLAALGVRHLAAVRDADAEGYRRHTERLTLLAALGVEPRGPVSAERRLELEIRQGVLLLEVMACRHGANRARAALRIVRSPRFRSWYAETSQLPQADVAVVSAFCAAYPADPGVLDLSVRTELVPTR
jgi:hypothetical protein